MELPKSLQNLIEAFERLPGVGPKSAQRLAFYILKQQEAESLNFANSVLDVKSKLRLCSKCFNVSEGELCVICSNENRDKNILCVVENVLNLVAIEKTGYRGLYHVLHGVLNPLYGVNVEDIKLESLLTRINSMVLDNTSTDDNHHLELIIATNPTMEGESTALFIKRQLEQNGLLNKVKITRIGRGLPTGADIEYADKATLDNALMGRVDF